MEEDLENAKEELKRIDHLIYVTLKYTRTVDVLKSVIERMINAYQFLIEALTKKAVEMGGSEEGLTNPISKANFVLENYNAKIIQDNIPKYLLFRKLRRVEYDKENEFRRHVTMIAEVDEKEVRVDIDSITEDFHNLRKTVEYVEKQIK